MDRPRSRGRVRSRPHRDVRASSEQPRDWFGRARMLARVPAPFETDRPPPPIAPASETLPRGFGIRARLARTPASAPVAADCRGTGRCSSEMTAAPPGLAARPYPWQGIAKEDCRIGLRQPSPADPGWESGPAHAGGGNPRAWDQDTRRG